MKLKNLVGREWVSSLSGRVAPVLNPATAEVIALAPVGDEADVDRAVTAAAKALPGWLDTTPAERADMLLRLAAAIEEHADELAALAVGNVCVLKPAEQTPVSTLRLAELAQEIFPPGVINVITGDGDPVGGHGESCPSTPWRTIARSSTSCGPRNVITLLAIPVISTAFLFYIELKSVPGLGGWTSGSLVALYVMLGIGAVIMIWGRLGKTSPYFSTPREVFLPLVTPLRTDSEFPVP